MYKVKHIGYCGMTTLDETTEDRQEARAIAADFLWRIRGEGFPVTILTKGTTWEIEEPEDNYALVPDECGVLSIKHVTFECRECGSQCETKEDSWQCCTYHEEWEE